MRQFLHLEPVRTLSAALAFGAAVIALLAFLLDWSGDLTAAVQLIWSTFVALVGSFFTRSQVTPVEE